MTPSLHDFATAANVARAYIAEHPEGPNWYPCGFAWVSAPKMRKNGKGWEMLKAVGFKWNDYDKRYQLWAGAFHNTQSMDYKAEIMRVYADALAKAGFPGFTVGTRID